MTLRVYGTIAIRLRYRFTGTIPIPDQIESGHPNKRVDRAGADRGCSRPSKSNQSRTRKNFDMESDDAVSIQRRHAVITRARRKLDNGAIQASDEEQPSEGGKYINKTRTRVRSRGGLPHP